MFLVLQIVPLSRRVVGWLEGGLSFSRADRQTDSIERHNIGQNSIIKLRTTGNRGSTFEYDGILAYCIVGHF